MKKSLDPIKTVKNRDAATRVLRSIGIRADDYNNYISKEADGTLVVQVARAEAHLASVTKKRAMPETKSRPIARRGVDVQLNGKPQRGDLSKMARSLIAAGKSNEEVWSVIQPAFDLDDKKKYYPAWYRAEMNRNSKKAKAA